jgi:hypothetical protein
MICFGERPIFGKEDLILKHEQQVARKQHAEKEGKTTCRKRRENNMQKKKGKQHVGGKATWRVGRQA